MRGHKDKVQDPVGVADRRHDGHGQPGRRDADLGRPQRRVHQAQRPEPECRRPRGLYAGWQAAGGRHRLQAWRLRRARLGGRHRQGGRHLHQARQRGGRLGHQLRTGVWWRPRRRQAYPIQIWDPRTGEGQQILEGTGKITWSVGFSPRRQEHHLGRAPHYVNHNARGPLELQLRLPAAKQSLGQPERIVVDAAGLRCGLHVARHLLAGASQRAGTSATTPSSTSRRTARRSHRSGAIPPRATATGPTRSRPTARPSFRATANGTSRPTT